MIWILLAILGVPVWLVVGALLAAFFSRRSFKHAPDVFPAKLRIIAGDAPGVKTSWPRLPVYARWVHDVLLVQKGVPLMRTHSLPVARAIGVKRISQPGELKGLGPEPAILTLILDNDANVEIAAPSGAVEDMVGPFVAVLASEAGA